MTTEPKHQPIANPAYARAMVELRRSNAAGLHADRRERRRKTRLDKLRQALRDESA